MSSTSLIYCFDPLCGWCYGIAPAMRALIDAQPDLAIEILPGGLFTGDGARPYSDLVGHIRHAEVTLQHVTGRKPSEAFHAMIAKPNAPWCDSARPSQAVLQMKVLAPAHALEFAHLLQEAHYDQGKDLNLGQTYDELCVAHGFPMLDTQAVTTATAATPLVAASFARSASLFIRAYPTLLVVGAGERVVGNIQGVYEPEALIAAVQKYQRVSLAPQL